MAEASSPASRAFSLLDGARKKALLWPALRQGWGMGGTGPEAAGSYLTLA